MVLAHTHHNCDTPNVDTGTPFHPEQHFRGAVQVRLNETFVRFSDASFSEITQSWLAPEPVLGKTKFVRGVYSSKIVYNLFRQRVFRFGLLYTLEKRFVGDSHHDVRWIDICVSPSAKKKEEEETRFS